MRRLLVTVVMLSSAAMLGPALALEASDTMKAWKNASDKDRSELLEQVIGKDAAQSAGVAKCMNETSVTPGHSDLPIGEVAKVCASSGKSEQPV